jgi:hypothetical protein
MCRSVSAGRRGVGFGSAELERKEGTEGEGERKGKSSPERERDVDEARAELVEREVDVDEGDGRKGGGGEEPGAKVEEREGGGKRGRLATTLSAVRFSLCYASPRASCVTLGQEGRDTFNLQTQTQG